jgi:hypothetical protein
VAVGASGGAINPKTHQQKWLWAYIEAIAELDDEVVSEFDCCVFLSYQYYFLIRRRLVRLVEAASSSMTRTGLLGSSDGECDPGERLHVPQVRG